MIARNHHYAQVGLPRQLTTGPMTKCDDHEGYTRKADKADPSLNSRGLLIIIYHICHAMSGTDAVRVEKLDAHLPLMQALFLIFPSHLINSC